MVFHIWDHSFIPFIVLCENYRSSDSLYSWRDFGGDFSGTFSGTKEESTLYAKRNETSGY